MINLVNWIFENTKRKEKIAISMGGESISYPQAYNKIISLSRKINEGIGENKNILLIADNSIFFVISYLSIIGSGNVCVPLKYDKNMNLKLIKERAESTSVFVQEKYSSILEGFGFEKIFTEKSVPTEIEQVDTILKNYEPSKVAVIIFTSGTTGEPKGVMLSHKNIIANTDSIIEGLFITEKDKVMVVLPFYYCFGATLLHTHLRTGGEMVINNNFFSPQKIIDEILEKKCTEIAGVPTTFQILLRQTKMKQTQFPFMRCVQQAGGKLVDPYLRELVSIFGYEKIFVMYGQTEATSRLSILDPKYLRDHFGSVGRGIKGTKLKILNPDLTPTPQGEPGEIYAEGENVMQGYYKDDEETKRKIIQGMLKTGDIAREDEEGFVYILDRESEFIKSRGYRISGRIIEQVIAEMPQIIEVAVVGVPDNLLGEKIIAYLSLNAEIEPKKILQYCSEKLQSHEVPNELIILKELPKNQSFKTDYKKLKKDYDQLKGLNDHPTF